MEKALIRTAETAATRGGCVECEVKRECHPVYCEIEMPDGTRRTILCSLDEECTEKIVCRACDEDGVVDAIESIDVGVIDRLDGIAAGDVLDRIGGIGPVDPQPFDF